MARAMTLLAGCMAVMAAAGPASAWTRPGHMVTAAIAWEEIAKRKPELLEKLGAMLTQHPDHGAFQVAIDRTTGIEQARRMFLECARWPDDARGTTYDHPSWHASLRPVIGKGAPKDVNANAISGEGIEALHLNYLTLRNPRATAPERARALCWVLHIAGDLHQPLHAGEQVSSDYPAGDEAGSKQYVKDPLTGQPISLHWLWDDAVHRSGAVADVDARVAALMKTYPRASLSEAREAATTDQIETSTLSESHSLAQTVAYGAGMPTSSAPETAPAAPQPMWQIVQKAAERRVAIAGYRMADLVIAALSGG